MSEHLAVLALDLTTVLIDVFLARHADTCLAELACGHTCEYIARLTRTYLGVTERCKTSLDCSRSGSSGARKLIRQRGLTHASLVSRQHALAILIAHH